MYTRSTLSFAFDSVHCVICIRCWFVLAVDVCPLYLFLIHFASPGPYSSENCKINSYSGPYSLENCKVNSYSIQRPNSRFFTISSLRREPSLTRRLKWSRRNRVQITCNTSSAYHVQYLVLRTAWYEGTAQLSSLIEFTSHLFELLFYWLNHELMSDCCWKISVTLNGFSCYCFGTCKYRV